MYQLISLPSVPELAKHGYNNVHLFVPKTNQVLLLKSIRDNKKTLQTKWHRLNTCPPGSCTDAKVRN